MKALLVVDLQNDFLPGGTLPAPEGDRIIPVINRMMPYFELVVGSRDWHPMNTSHFERWPAHCIQGTDGAAPPDAFHSGELQSVFLKGCNTADDGYSAFQATNADLDKYLKENEIKQLFLAGLTLEFCVKETAIDALKKGYLTYVVKDATAAVNINKGDREKTIHELKQSGVIWISSRDIPSVKE